MDLIPKIIFNKSLLRDLYPRINRQVPCSFYMSDSSGTLRALYLSYILLYVGLSTQRSQRFPVQDTELYAAPEPWRKLGKYFS